MTVTNGKPEEGEKKENENSIGDDTWGADMYPERRGKKLERNWFKMMLGLEGRESADRNRCETNVYNCIQSSEIYI